MSQNVGSTIYNAARQCSDVFDRILKSTDNGSAQFLLTEELRGRFSLWTAYVGVYAAPKASLDARLHGHKKINDMVLELVEMVQRNLQWAAAELSVEPKSTNGTQSSLDPVDDEAHDDSSMDVLGLNAAEAAIDRLLILAVAIRRSARRNHTLRHGTNDQQAQAELLCCLLVKARYPNARNSLCNQLGASIYTRGTSLLYLKMHNEKLAFERHDPSSVQDAAGKDATSANDDQRLDNCVDRPIIDKQPGALGPETIPSVLSPSVVSRFTKTKNKPSGSIVSRGWTVRDGQGDNFYYPPKPEVINDKKYQSCNLCGDPLEESNLTQETWEAHVDQDLEPYVCISEECREPPRYFLRRQDWLDHMQTRHSMAWADKIHTEQWYCDIGHDNPPEFDEKESFVAHLYAEHGNQLTKSKLEGRARRNRRIAMREPFVCPLCGCVPDGLEPRVKEKLWHHIADHLKSLAFLSLSYVDDDPGEKESITVFGNDDKDDANISRTSLRNRTLESFDDIPTTDVLENGMRSVDGQEFSGEPPLLNPPQTWTFLPSNTTQPDFELLRRQLQGPMSVVSNLSEPSEEHWEPKRRPAASDIEKNLARVRVGEAEGDRKNNERYQAALTEPSSASGPTRAAGEDVAAEPAPGPDSDSDIESEGVWGYLVPLNPEYGEKPIVLKKRSALPPPETVADATKADHKYSKGKAPSLKEEGTYEKGKIRGVVSGGYLIGRHPECDIVVNDDIASNRHCLIFNENKGSNSVAILENLSRNGTYVNGTIVGCNQRRELEEQDEIAFHGKARFVFRYPKSRQTSAFKQQYRLLEKLGKSQFTEVYLCVEKSTGQRYAVKFFTKHSGMGDRATTEAALQQEIGVLMGVNHPNVLCLKDTFNERDRIYLVLELAPEGELFNYIVMKQKLSEEETRKVFIQLFQGVKYLHERNIMHRDIKPENILLVDKELHIKLADFGLAKIVEEEDFTTTLCGTPTYVAPEILAESKHRMYTKAVDIWSLGVVLYICLCGFPPFSDELYSRDFPFTLSQQIRSGRFDYPSPYWDAVGDPALDLIDSMIVVNPEKRFTIDQCLAHPWITQTVPNVDDNGGIVGGINELEVRRRVSARKQTLLSSVNDVQAAETAWADFGGPE